MKRTRTRKKPPPATARRGASPEKVAKALLHPIRPAPARQSQPRPTPPTSS